MKEPDTLDVNETISRLLASDDHEALTEFVDALRSKEAIYLVGRLKREDQIKLLTSLTPEVAAELMEDIPDVQAADIIEELRTQDAAAILNEMDSNEQADLLLELDQKDAYAILEKMAPEEAEDVRRLITFDPETAGGIMRTEFFVYRENQSVSEVTEDLRTHFEEYQEYFLKYIFVVSPEGVLKGVLQMVDLLLATGNTLLRDIITPEIHFVNYDATLGELNDFFHTHDYLGIPVTDENKVLIGVVLRGDVFEAESERATQEHLETQGIIDGDELRTMPVFFRAKRRLSWLSVNILLNILAASVIAFHQDVLSSVIALAVFLPIISDMSGCSGNQAVAVSMRELSLGVVRPAEVFRVWWQEISVGVINGLALGILIGIAAVLWKANFYLGMVVGGALFINTLVAVSIGGTIPLLLKGMNIDPALASSPILTTITDMFGFFLALTFASFFLVELGGI